MNKKISSSQKLIIISIIIPIIIVMIVLNNSTKDVSLGYGLVYTSVCSIGNIRHENPEAYKTAQQQFSACNEREDKTRDAGYYFYDFATDTVTQIPSKKMSYLEKVLQFPTNDITEPIKYTGDVGQGMPYTRINFAKGIELAKDETTTEIVCDVPEVGEYIGRLICSVYVTDTSDSSQDSTQKVYVIEERGNGDEIILPSVLLWNDTFAKIN